MKVKLTQNWRFYNRGDEIEVFNNVGDALIKASMAEAVKEKQIKSAPRDKMIRGAPKNKKVKTK